MNEINISHKIPIIDYAYIEKNLKYLGLKNSKRTTIKGNYHFIIFKISPVNNHLVTISKLFYHNNCSNGKTMLPSDILPKSPYILIYAIPAANKGLADKLIVNCKKRFENVCWDA